MKKRLCVIIPAYNEAKVLRSITKESIGIFNSSAYSIDVVVVNDGSKDITSSEGRKGGAIVIDHILNTGAGGATATGLSYANQSKYDAAATMDADGQHSAEDVLRGFDILFSSDIDLLIGSRLIDSHGMSRVKILGNRGLSFITQILFSIKTTDPQSGLRNFCSSTLERHFFCGLPVTASCI